MPLFGRRRGRGTFSPPLALVASATETTARESQRLTHLHQPWQARVFSYYDSMGECWDPAQFVARAMAKGRLFAATGDPDDPEVLTSGWAFDLVEKWAQIPEPYGRLRALIGEGRLTYSVPPDSDEDPVWEFLSPTELSLTEEGRTIMRDTGAEKMPYRNISRDEGFDPQPGEMRMWRFWRPHPQKSHLADSSFRGVLELYEQLYWLTLSEKAELRNRAMNQGILLVPEEIDFAPDGAEEQAQDGEGDPADPFQEQLQEMMTEALRDPGTAAAATPGVVRGPAEYLKPEHFRHIRFHDPASSLYMSGREQALIDRIAIGLNMPPEVLSGLKSMNHWSAWKLADEKFQHVQPEGVALVKDLTDAVLRPIGRASGETDAEAVFVGIDWSELVSDPDKGQTAITLYGMGVVGAAATRNANDFDDGTKPTPEEHLEYLAIALKDSSLVGGMGPTPAPVVGAEAPPIDDGTDGAPPADATPPAAGDASADISRRIITAAATDARAATGRWVLGRRRSCPDCFEMVNGEAAQYVIPLIGTAGLQGVKVGVGELSARMRDRFYETAGALGMDVDVARAADVEAWFVGTMFDRQPNTLELADHLGV